MERICRDLLKLKIKRSKYETKDGKDNIMVKYYSKVSIRSNIFNQNIFARLSTKTETEKMT